MERAEAQRIIGELNSELAETQLAMNDMVRRMSGLRKVIDGYVELFPDLAPPPIAPSSDESLSAPPDRPRGQEAVREVLVASAGKWWTAAGMVRELERHGWLPESPSPANAVRNALERVIASDPTRFRRSKGEKSGAVTFSYRPFEHHAAVGPSKEVAS